MSVCVCACVFLCVCLCVSVCVWVHVCVYCGIQHCMVIYYLDRFALNLCSDTSRSSVPPNMTRRLQSYLQLVVCVGSVSDRQTDGTGKDQRAAAGAGQLWGTWSRFLRSNRLVEFWARIDYSLVSALNSAFGKPLLFPYLIKRVIKVFLFSSWPRCFILVNQLNSKTNTTFK